MAAERGQASEADAILLDEEAVMLPPASKPSRRAALLTLSLLAVTAAVVALLSWPTDGPGKGMLTRVSNRPSLVELEEKEEEPGLCDALPYLKIMKLKSSNLGEHGPDKEAEEGMIYETTAFKGGLGNITDVELHIHVTKGDAFLHSEEEGTALPEDYTPAWPSQNGIHGGFATINIKPGTNVTLLVHGYNPATKEDLTLPKAAVTFFDLDTGKDGTRSVEFVTMQGHSAYFLTNETEVNVSHGEEGGTTFSATKEGSGSDNPKDPLALTVQQKNRAVSFMFENAKNIVVQLGASEGKTARVFSFVMRPALRCAKTVLDDGTILDANSTDSPITIVRGASEQVRPLLVLTLGLALVGSAWDHGH